MSKIFCSNESEQDEFIELSSGNGDDIAPSRAKRKKRIGNLVQPDFDDEDDCANPGALVQYALHGQGYLPTTATKQRLDAGVYDIITTNSGNTLVKHEIVTDKLLRLPDSRSDEVIAEIEKFWTLKPKFQAYGFTHKRGILLWGPPGSGKTATISVIISQTIKNDGIVFIGNSVHPVNLSDILSKFREIEPERQLIVVLEDIDTIIENYGESEVLSIMDGEKSIDNVVFLATTNYPENLDGRIINRPSRFDRIVKIGMPSAAAREFYLRNRAIENDIDVPAWVAATEGFSIAHIKELIVGVCCYGNSFKSEVDRLRKMFNRTSSASDKSIGFDSVQNMELIG